MQCCCSISVLPARGGRRVPESEGGVTLPALVYDILPFGGGAGKRVWCGVCRLRPKSQCMWINSELYSFGVEDGRWVGYTLISS